jgi:hypothetical protein
MSKASRVQRSYELANETAARIIAADPAKYPPGGLAAMWAALVLEKATAAPAAEARAA